MKKLCERLSIAYHEELLPFYEKGMKLKKEYGTYIFDKDRLSAINAEYQIFREYFPVVLDAIDAILQSEDLVLHTYILLSMILEDADITKLELSDRQRKDTDFAPLFAILYFLEDMIADMEQRKVPYPIISDTLNAFEIKLKDYYGLFGRYGARRYINWFMHWVKKEIIRVGRLEFERKILKDRIRVYQKGDDIKILMDDTYMHKKGMVFGAVGQNNENEKYYADIIEENSCVTGYAANDLGECVPRKITLKGYIERLRCGDKVLGVHIPSEAPFNRELWEASYEQVAEIIKKCYPEFDYKAFYCNSWMLEKRLREIMGRDTNITRFAERYHVFPTNSAGRGVFTSLYRMPVKVSPETLPELSSMQKAVKAYLCEGNHFYEKGGCFFAH